MLFIGQSEFVLRAVPALLGILTIPVFYLIGKEFYDKNVGIISAALLTVSILVFIIPRKRPHIPWFFSFLPGNFIIFICSSNRQYNMVGDIRDFFGDCFLDALLCVRRAWRHLSSCNNYKSGSI